MKVTSLMSTTAGVICLIASLLLYAVPEVAQVICSSLQFRHSNGSCLSCQSVVCLPGYEPSQLKQLCGNGRPLYGDGCVKCDSAHFSATGAKCIGCSICTRREAAISCNGVNDTVCGRCRAGYFEENGRCISCSHHLNPEDSQDCASSHDVTEQMKDLSPSKSGQSLDKNVDVFAHNATYPVVYISLMFAIVLSAVVGILCCLCCCCPPKGPDQTQQNKSAPGQQQEMEVNIGEGDYLLVDNQAPQEDEGPPENVRGHLLVDNPAPPEDVGHPENVRGHQLVGNPAPPEDVGPPEDVRGCLLEENPAPPEDVDHLEEVIGVSSRPGSDERRETDSNNTWTSQGGSRSENEGESQSTSSSMGSQPHGPSTRAIESPEELVAYAEHSDDEGVTDEEFENQLFSPELSSF